MLSASTDEHLESGQQVAWLSGAQFAIVGDIDRGHIAM